ncbi:hypothetical protein CK203_025064 [Vitis vinifera]|uniref:Retrovirus-related Pol polyprotein from transposon RE1 n=1 Tax=Vitis vinifera TaxID=29760 RepID=A0A438J7C3_VITVI|nr:hypothetical protein CK203_025064 [Vitis vinifera]
MEESKTMKTPMSSSIKLDKDEKGKSIDPTMYRGMIAFLLYLTPSRPDIMYSMRLTTTRAQGKRLVEPSQREACRKTRFENFLFNVVEKYQWYKQHFSHKRVVLERDIDFAQ